MRRLICVATLALLAILYIQTAAVAKDGAMSADVQVSIKNFAFHPPTLRITKGTEVDFKNNSGVTHTATQNGGGFNSKPIAPGDDFSVRFRKAGTFLYHCNIHPYMKGKIVVQ